MNLKITIRNLVLLVYNEIVIFCGTFLTVFGTVGSLSPNIFDFRSRKGKNDLIFNDAQQNRSFDYQDKMRKRRFAYACCLVVGLSIMLYYSYMSFLSALATYFSH